MRRRFPNQHQKQDKSQNPRVFLPSMDQLEAEQGNDITDNGNNNDSYDQGHAVIRHC